MVIGHTNYCKIKKVFFAVNFIAIYYIICLLTNISFLFLFILIIGKWIFVCNRLSIDKGLLQRYPRFPLAIRTHTGPAIFSKSSSHFFICLPLFLLLFLGYHSVIIFVHFSSITYSLISSYILERAQTYKILIYLVLKHLNRCWYVSTLDSVHSEHTYTYNHAICFSCTVSFTSSG